MSRVFPRWRRYAELGYLLPSSIGPAVENPVYRPFLLARQLSTNYYAFGKIAMPKVAGLGSIYGRGPVSRPKNPTGADVQGPMSQFSTGGRIGGKQWPQEVTHDEP
jgi:hypothetical protein